MPRKPEGAQALNGAERQARYRARQHGPEQPAPQPRPTAARIASRVQRWHAAVRTLIALQGEYAGWLMALPEPTRDSATGEALQAIVELDLDELAAIVPPRGFGRD